MPCASFPPPRIPSTWGWVGNRGCNPLELRGIVGIQQVLHDESRGNHWVLLCLILRFQDLLVMHSYAGNIKHFQLSCRMAWSRILSEWLIASNKTSLRTESAGSAGIARQNTLAKLRSLGRSFTSQPCGLGRDRQRMAKTWFCSFQLCLKLGTPKESSR